MHRLPEEKSGLYLGTEIDKTWWKRYSKDGFFARGNGLYDYDDTAFYFYRYPQNSPLVISFENIADFEIGKWHAGKWGAGLPVLKIVWKNGSHVLSSGFILSRGKEETEKIISELRHRF